MATSAPSPAWYAEVTRYQWLVLGLASAGWVFDVYQGQIYNITRHQLLADVLKPAATEAAIKYYGDVFLAIFLVGGAVGHYLGKGISFKNYKRAISICYVIHGGAGNGHRSQAAPQHVPFGQDARQHRKCRYAHG